MATQNPAIVRSFLSEKDGNSYGDMLAAQQAGDISDWIRGIDQPGPAYPIGDIPTEMVGGENISLVLLSRRVARTIGRGALSTLEGDLKSGKWRSSGHGWRVETPHGEVRILRRDDGRAAQITGITTRGS